MLYPLRPSKLNPFLRCFAAAAITGDADASVDVSEVAEVGDVGDVAEVVVVTASAAMAPLRCSEHSRRHAAQRRHQRRRKVNDAADTDARLASDQRGPERGGKVHHLKVILRDVVQRVVKEFVLRFPLSASKLGGGGPSTSLLNTEAQSAQRIGWRLL